MTPEQEKTIAELRRKVFAMRGNGTPDGVIRARLFNEGWPAAAVVEAVGGRVEPEPMTRPGNVIHD